jgi:hypothetical protein
MSLYEQVANKIFDIHKSTLTKEEETRIAKRIANKRPATIYETANEKSGIVTTSDGKQYIVTNGTLRRKK